MAGGIAVAMSVSLTQLYLARGLQGIGASFTMITAIAWVRDNYDGINAAKWLLSYG